MIERRFLLVTVLCALTQVIVAKEFVPVMMWGATKGSSLRDSALTRTSTDEFQSLLQDQLNQHTFTVVFIEETLSVEDFSQKDDDGNTPYPELKQRISDDSFKYMPFVANPMHALNKVAEPSGIDHVEMTDEGLSADILPGPGRILYISLKDAREGEDRFKLLTRHDRFMTEMYTKLLKKHHSVLAIYTARFPSWEIFPERSKRTGRQLLQEPDLLTGFYNGSEKIYMYAPTITVISRNSNDTALENGVATIVNSTDDTQTLSIQFGTTNVEFVFFNDRSFWIIKTVDVKLPERDLVTLSAGEVGAPDGFSYHCGQTIKFKIANSTLPNSDIELHMTDFQIQAFFGLDSIGRFGSAYDCVGVMTIPIWSGIFLVAILLFITSGGIMMMMDIKTMDRFDDPKGKTITISTTE